MNWQSTITIHRPVETVFAFVTDAEGGTKWHRANRITPVSPGPIQLGSTYRVEGRFLFWTFDSLSEVTAFEPDRLVEYSSDAGMYAYTLRYELERTESGTRFTEIGVANPKGMLKFAIRLFAGGAKRNSKRGLELLKTELES
ncbi:MAG TPA: SRPBCC family protein [Anaerolineales bacterium]|nr:SRPBCC family protein [Anaerolineales bacterium]